MAVGATEAEARWRRGREGAVGGGGGGEGGGGVMVAVIDRGSVVNVKVAVIPGCGGPGRVYFRLPHSTGGAQLVV